MYLYDFDDYVDCVEKSGIAIKMQSSDFFDLKSYKSVAKDTRYPLLSTISEVQFRRKSTKMYWKTSFHESTYKSGQFLQKKFRDQCLKHTDLPIKGPARGVNMKKKDDILYKLTELMLQNHRKFWRDLPANETSDDLSINLEHLKSKK